MTAEQIAQKCHEANKAYCESIGDFSQVSWEDAPEWQKQSAINGVNYFLSNPNSTPEDMHDQWWKEKIADGWKYGPFKDAEKKEHPAMMVYRQLPEEQRVKDQIFIDTINSCK